MARQDQQGGTTKTAYTESDVEVVMRQGDWKNWDEVIRWLETEGDNHRRLRTDEVQAMIEDFRRLKKERVRFTKDPAEIYRKIQER